MLKSPTVLVGGLGLVVAVAWFAFGGWLSGVKPPQASTVSTLPPAPPLPAVQGPQPVGAAAQRVSVPVVQPVRIQGGLLTEVQGAPQWLYVSESGRIMTDEEIAMVSGGIVNARMDRGVRILYGSGVVWGGAASMFGEAGASIESAVPVPSLANRGTEERVPVVEIQPVPSGSPGTDVFATPPGILATPPPIN